jgi:hypothetical protein
MVQQNSIFPADLARELDYEVERLVASIESAEWDENSISYEIVKTIRQTLRRHSCIRQPQSISRYPQEDRGSNLFLDVEIYKVTGAPEQAHGDIAVVVRNEVLHRAGVGFYEAKAQGVAGNFPAFSRRQFQRLSTNTPLLSLLLYQRQPGSVSTDMYGVPRIDQGLLGQNIGRVRVFRANVIRLFGDPSNIPWEAETFGSHFVRECLAGKALDYSRDPETAIRRWLSATKRTAPIVISITISRSLSAAEPHVSLSLPNMEPVPLDMPLLATDRTRVG